MRNKILHINKQLGFNGVVDYFNNLVKHNECYDVSFDAVEDNDYIITVSRYHMIIAQFHYELDGSSYVIGYDNGKEWILYDV